MVGLRLFLVVGGFFVPFSAFLGTGREVLVLDSIGE